MLECLREREEDLVSLLVVVVLAAMIFVVLTTLTGCTAVENVATGTIRATAGALNAIANN